MRKRAVILLAILIAIFGGSVNAQSFLGKLVDDKEAPVGFANVVLLNPEDSAFVKGTVSEESGEFVLEGLKEQCYILRVSYIGYKDKVFNNVSLNLGARRRGMWERSVWNRMPSPWARRS